MIGRIVERMKDKKTRDLACVAGGAAALMLGRKITGLALFGKGMWGLEQAWRDRHGFEGTWAERWEAAEKFYEGTHQHPANRALHMVGIPIIVAGASGMLAFRPYGPLWAASNGAWTFGWVLNFIGHGVFEKNAPAFADDPLSFVAGPMWDLEQFRKTLGLGDASEPAGETPELKVHTAA